MSGTFDAIQLVDEDQLPEGTSWAAYECQGEHYLFVKRSRCIGDCGRCPVVAEAVDAIRLPRPRQPSSSTLPSASNA